MLVLPLQYVASVGSGKQHQKAAKVLLTSHYLNDTNRFDVSRKGPSSGISGPLLENDKGPLFETSNLFLSHR